MEADGTKWSGGGAAGDDFLGGGRGGNQGGHFADHGQDEALVAIGERVGVLLDFGEEADFVLPAVDY